MSITSQNPMATVASLTVQLNLTSPNLKYLSAVLIAPDGKTTVTLFSNGILSGSNLAGTIFSDSATSSLASGTAPYAGTFLTVDSRGLAQLAGQSINGTWTLQLTNYLASNSSTLTNWSLAITPNPVTTSQTFSVAAPVAIPASTPVSSPIAITGQGTSTTVANLNVTLNLSFPNLGDLSAVLVGPDGITQVTLFNAGALTGSSLVNTVFSATASTSLSSGTSPYTGTFKATDPQGLAKLLGQSMNGTWTLKLTNTATGQSGTLTSWSLTLTPLATTTPQTFPLLPGTSIPAANSVSSTQTITGQGTLTVASLTVQVNVTFPNLANLSAVLSGPDGTQVTLFNAGDLFGTNLVNTTFSDSATTSLSSGRAPYTGTFLTNDSTGLKKLIGKTVDGNWTLKVTNTATGQTGTINSWSLLISPSGTGNSPVPAVTPAQTVAIPVATPAMLTSTLPVSGNGDAIEILSLMPQISITAPNLADLSGVLISPDGKTQVTLFNVGDLSGSQMINTTVQQFVRFSSDHERHIALHGYLLRRESLEVPGHELPGQLDPPDHQYRWGQYRHAGELGTRIDARSDEPAAARSGRRSSLRPRTRRLARATGTLSPPRPRMSRSGSANGQALGAATDIPMQGDFSGDGKDDLATYNQTTAVWTMDQSSGGTSTFTFGTPSSATYAGSLAHRWHLRAARHHSQHRFRFLGFERAWRLRFRERPG